MSIFKAYDIRGTFPDQLDATTAHRVGRATARFIGAKRLVVARDARAHSPELVGELIRGIREEGAEVIDLGLAGTPMVYYAVDHLGAGGGIMLTASHNPAQYNGFKICRENAIPVGGETGLAEIEALSASIGSDPIAEPLGALTSYDAVPGYVEHALAIGGRCPEAHVAIDCGNGMAAVALEPILERLPLEVERLYFEPDGTFPNHPADPLKLENLADVSAAVRSSGAAFGVAFDGDADRAVFIDESGEPIPSDLMTAVLARSQLRNTPGGTVLYDLRSSWATAEEIEAAGGKAKMCRVGHSFVKADMRRDDAIFAGELSGHFYFRFSPTLVADDGIAAFIALLDVLAESKQPLSELIAPLRRYFTSGEISEDAGSRERMSEIMEQVAADHTDADDVSWMDGLLVRYEDWWFNLRPSNTEPLLRLNLEARTEARMIEERDRLVARMR
jgi:phosphomannomutase